MDNHNFIFKPGLWVGEGKITFSASPDRLRFYTKWIIEQEKNSAIVCQQTVEMEGGSNVFNTFTFFNLKPTSFSLELTNELLGSVQGTGLVDEKTIAWEFRSHSEFQGFEVYELQDNGDYMLHAEYSSVDLVRTIIDGRIWKKVT